MTKAPAAHVAYVMKRYPRLSETFILNEIAIMESLGVRLTLFSLLQPEPPPHHPMVKDISAPLRHLPPQRAAKIAALARAHGACLGRAPLRYLRALAGAAAASARSRRPLGVWKQFLRAGFVADRCRRDGVTLIHAHFANAPGAVAGFASLRVRADREHMGEVDGEVAGRTRDLSIALHEDKLTLRVPAAGGTRRHWSSFWTSRP